MGSNPTESPVDFFPQSRKSIQYRPHRTHTCLKESPRSVTNCRVIYGRHHQIWYLEEMSTDKIFIFVFLWNATSFKSQILLTLTPQIFWLGTFLNPPKSISTLLETCPYLQNVDLSYSALMACTCCQVVIYQRIRFQEWIKHTLLSLSKLNFATE